MMLVESLSTKKEQMEEILSLKFDQHQDLRDQLLRTGDSELVEVCPAPLRALVSV